MLHDESIIAPRMAALAFSVSILIFGVLAALAASGALDPAEQALMLSLRNLDDPAALRGPTWTYYFMLNITALGGWPVLTLLSLILAGGLAINRQWTYVLIWAAVVIGITLLTEGLKEIFSRARPDFLPHLSATSSASFPSGHSGSAAAVYFTLGLAVANLMKAKALRAYAMASAVLIVALIGVSRVFLGVHYPSDVIAGWCVGAAWASAIWLGVWRLTEQAKP